MENLLRGSGFSETAMLFTDEKIANARTKIVEALNESQTATPSVKCEIIAKLQELLLHSDVELLNEFLENILVLSHDSNQDVRKAIAGFIEEMCKQHIALLPKVVGVLFTLLRDTSPNVTKRVIQGCGSIYRSALQWICSLDDIPEEVEQAWNTLCLVKASILDMIDDNNDGIRTNAIKFLEGVVILQTYPDEDSMKRENDFSLEDVPLTMKLIRRRKLEDEATKIFELLLEFHGAMHISSVNLIACTGTLCIIAKLRPTTMTRVIEALKNLHSNLPPTLTNSQVSSVRKNLKMQFLNLLKHRASYEHQASIAQILVDLGASNGEITRAIPKMDKQEKQRRAKRALESAMAGSLQQAAKRSKTAEQEAKRSGEKDADGKQSGRTMEIDMEELNEQKARSTKLNEQFLVEALQKVDQVVQLVVTNMDKVSEQTLQASKPSATLTVEQYIQKIAHTLAVQMSDLKVGPGASAFTKDPPMKVRISDEEEKSIILAGKRKAGGDAASGEQPDAEDGHQDALPGGDGGEEDDDDEALSEDDRQKLEATRKLRETLERVKGSTTEPKLRQRIKMPKLSEITKPLPKATKETFLTDAVSRILRAERQALIGGVSVQRQRIITAFGASFVAPVRQVILDHILEDLPKRIELAFAWLFEEYSLLQGFAPFTHVKHDNGPQYPYTQLLVQLVTNLMERPKDVFRPKESLLKRLYLEAPLMPAEATELLVRMCELEELADCGMQIAKDLLIRRPPRERTYLNILLRYAYHENGPIREKAIEYVMNVFAVHRVLTEDIEARALEWLAYLEQENPPEAMFAAEYGRAEHPRTWNEELAKVSLALFLEVMVYDQTLLQRFSEVYIGANSEMKRAVIRAIEGPIRKIGPDSEELLRLIEQCPKGSETIIIRIIYILTEKTLPSPELVERVRTLHHTKVSDVRLLIPVINGLTKKEILNALPKLIKLNPGVVKEVFNRLLGVGAEFGSAELPLTPAELLVALHTIETSKVELKFIVKATSLCLAEKDVYTHDVLGSVMQQLVEMTPLPTLLMRTVIQSLTLHPRLFGFVTNLLQRLILKQVWKQKVVWDGFLKCAQRLTPQSLGILIQLPAPQLQDALNICPEFREPMLEHAREIMEHQIGHVSQPIMDVLLGISPYSATEANDLQIVGNYSEDAPMLSHLPVKIKQEKKEKDAEPPAAAMPPAASTATPSAKDSH
ncbi:symplekin-like [Anopheles albimanus]|uniref:Symplekin n=1 Tax=Anopheles albimanus TaxID=7167 RepID=A0A182FAZ0_ANOAL|nr:symplekin-like [Anopheles albimanus]XP_035795244.1 symplekin-like [Anopheles albimanus]XP_035795245.1 symplekin-like [Anopheles albimanus]